VENNPFELQLTFAGNDRIKGFTLKQVKHSNLACFYEVSDTFNHNSYRMLVGKINARFGNIAYPKQNTFGIRAWSYRAIEKANERFNNLTERSIHK